MKNKLGGKIMTELPSLKPKTYTYLTNDNDENKKSKRHKKVCHKTKTSI